MQRPQLLKGAAELTFRITGTEKQGRMAGKGFYSFTLPMVMPDTKYLCRKG